MSTQIHFLCLGKMNEHTEANAKWNDQLLEFQHSNSYRELFGIDAEPIEFEWNSVPRLTTSEILQKIQKNLDDRQINPAHFESRMMLMSMFIDVDWTMKEKSKICPSNSEEVKNYAKKGFSVDTDHSSAQETKINGVERTPTNLKENGIPLRKTWWKTSKKLDIQYSEV